MIVSFKNEDTEDTFNGNNMNATRKTCPESLWKTTFRQVDQLDAEMKLEPIRIPPGNRLEALGTGRIGRHRFHINDPYRVWLRWSESDHEQVEFIDYHSTLRRAIVMIGSRWLAKGRQQG